MCFDVLCVVAASNWRGSWTRGVSMYVCPWLRKRKRWVEFGTEEYILGVGAGPAGVEPLNQLLGTDGSRTTNRDRCGSGELGANSSAS